MYATCLFCHSRLGQNETIERFTVGRRLAFDAKRGRLWVVCGGCGRWNLSPLEERWEAIEDCERQFRAARTRLTTDEIGLARLPDGFELVRIGSPLRPEFASWRYGTRFTARRRRARWALGAAAAVAGVGAVAFAPALAMGALSVVIIPGVTTAMGVVPVVGALQLKEYMQHDRVVGRLVYRRHPHVKPRQITVRAKHAAAAELTVRGRDPASVSLGLPHDSGWARFEGIHAMQAASTLMSGVNYVGGSTAQVRDAVRHIEDYGDAPTYLRAAASIGDARHNRLTSVMNLWRGLGAMRLSSTECLALEMALHEESERRALEGELALLEAAWRDAETVARIADAF